MLRHRAHRASQPRRDVVDARGHHGVNPGGCHLVESALLELGRPVAGALAFDGETPPGAPCQQVREARLLVRRAVHLDNVPSGSFEGLFHVRYDRPFERSYGHGQV